MHLIKINKIDSSADVANTASYLDATQITAMVVGATSLTVDYTSAAGAVKELVFTVTGNDTAEKLLNAQKLGDWFALIATQVVNSNGMHLNKVFDLGNQAKITADAGLLFTDAATEPLVRVVLSVD